MMLLLLAGIHDARIGTFLMRVCIQQQVSAIALAPRVEDCWGVVLREAKNASITVSCWEGMQCKQTPPNTIASI